MNFIYRSYPNEVIFGAGQLQRLPELARSYAKVMVLAPNRVSEIVDELEKQLGETEVARFTQIIQHVPEALVREARAIVQVEKPEVYLAIGGGSTIGLAKALALQDGLPIIAVPTTYAGSEQTNIYGISSDGGKRTGRDDRVLPTFVIYDPALTATMPKALAVSSAMNAMAHLMEALYAPMGNPLTRLSAMQGITEIKKGLEGITATDTLTSEANKALQFGAYLAGKCLCEVSMALHHKAAHVLGGIFGMEHSSVHTVLQAYVLAYQWPYLSEEIQSDFKQVFESAYPPMALQELAEKAGAPINLKSIGFREENIEQAAHLMSEQPYANIAPLTKEGLNGMLHRAYNGEMVRP